MQVAESQFAHSSKWEESEVLCNKVKNCMTMERINKEAFRPVAQTVYKNDEGISIGISTRMLIHFVSVITRLHTAQLFIQPFNL